MWTSPVPISAPSSTTSAQREVVATSSATGWLTYRDQTSGFSIQYPPSFRTRTDNGGLVIYSADTPDNYIDAQGLDFTPLLTRRDDETLWEFAHNSSPSPFGLDNDKVTIINGLTAYTFDFIYGSRIAVHTFLFKDSNHGIDVTYDTDNPFANYYQEMIQGFSFATATPVNL